jgi:hypothetical protein
MKVAGFDAPSSVDELARENALLKQQLAEFERTRLQMSVLQAREENARLLAMFQAQTCVQGAPWLSSHKRQGSIGAASTAVASSEASDVEVCSDDAISIISDEPAVERRTTVIVQNIPNRYTRSMLLDLFDAKGFSTAYDMVYLPTDFSTAVNFGYAFVNFATPESAEKFAAAFQGFSEWSCKSGKVCIVDWCAEQGGLELLIKRYQNCPVMHESVPDEYKPALYQAGKRIAFPAPTKKLRKPRMSGGRALA